MHSPLSNKSGHSALECLSGFVGLDLRWAHGQFELPNRVHIINELLSHPPPGNKTTHHFLNLYYLPTQPFNDAHNFFAHLLEPKAPLDCCCWVVFLINVSDLIDLFFK